MHVHHRDKIYLLTSHETEVFVPAYGAAFTYWRWAAPEGCEPNVAKAADKAKETALNAVRGFFGREPRTMVKDQPA